MAFAQPPADRSGPIPLFPDPPTTRRHVGRYELVAEIARGGMGTVYLARHLGEAGFQRLYAVKVMHSHLEEDVEFVGMFLDEARIAARIHHHNVVSILDLGKHRGTHFVVMDYVEGCTLAQLLRRRQGQRPRLIVPLLIDVLRGLHAAHTLTDDDGTPLGLVHRDVSPANILVGVDGVARITDFGIAKARARITSTMPGIHKGKLAYTAPEQLDGTEDIDARVDVFAAGAVMWKALTGREPFLGGSDGETIRNLLNRRVPPPSAVGLAPPACLDDVCLRALRRDPEERYASAGQMAEELREVAAANGLLGSPTDVSGWVGDLFGEELTARRRAIRDASTGGLSFEDLPSLPALRSQTVATSIERGRTGGDGVEELDDIELRYETPLPGPTESPSGSRLRRVVVLAAIALVSLASVGLALSLFGGGDEPAATPAVVEPTTVAPLAPSRLEVPTAVATPSPAPEPAEAAVAEAPEPAPEPAPDVEPASAPVAAAEPPRRRALTRSRPRHAPAPRKAAAPAPVETAEPPASEPTPAPPPRRRPRIEDNPYTRASK